MEGQKPTQAEIKQAVKDKERIVKSTKIVKK